MTARLDVTPKTTEQNRLVRTGKSEAEVTIVINKNLAIANRSRVSCAHNTLRAFIGLNITP